MSDVTQLLSQLQAGDPVAAEQLMPLVYEELRKLAAVQLAQESPGQTLDATALVHEAYIRLVGDYPYADRQHFFRIAAEAMRRILIDRARRKGRVKHGGQTKRVELEEISIAENTACDNLLKLDAALERLAEVAPKKAELVKLRFFAGLSEEEAATALGISRATASRQWTYSRAWLIHAIENEKA